MAYYPPKPERQEEKPPEPVSRKKVRPLRDRILLCVCVFFVAYGAVRLAGYGIELASSNRTRDELKAAAEATEMPREEPTPAAAAEQAAPAGIPTEIPTARPPETQEPEARAQAPAPAPEPASVLLPDVSYPEGTEISNRFKKLRKKSKYIVGWITMNNLDEPVVQKNNTYFLNHDAMGGKNSNGAIFLDENISLKTNRPYTLLVYGHNMKSGAMFGDLRKYRDYAYAARHRVFSFDTMYEDGKYAVFSVAVIHVEPGMSRYVDFRCLLADNREVRKKELEKLESFDEGGATVLDVNEEDQLLLLITCTGDDSERLVVSARRLRDGETEDSLHFRAN